MGTLRIPAFSSYGPLIRLSVLRFQRSLVFCARTFRAVIGFASADRKQNPTP